MVYIIFKSVGRKLTLDRSSDVPCAVTVGVTALNHKVADDSVEGKSVIEAAVSKGCKALYGLGCCVSVKKHGDSAVALNLDDGIVTVHVDKALLVDGNTDDNTGNDKNYCQKCCDEDGHLKLEGLFSLKLSLLFSLEVLLTLDVTLVSFFVVAHFRFILFIYVVCFYALNYSSGTSSSGVPESSGSSSSDPIISSIVMPTSSSMTILSMTGCLVLSDIKPSASP